MTASPTHRPSIEQSVRSAYVAAGLDPPGEIIWAQSPTQLAREWMSVKDHQAAGQNLRAMVLDVSRERCSRAALKSCAPDVHACLMNPPHAAADTLSEQINRANHRAIGAVEVPLSWRLNRVARSLFSISPRLRAWPSLAKAGASRHELGWLEPLAYLIEIDSSSQNTGLVRALWEVAQGTSWIIPHQHICWLADAPVLVQHDERGRLHASDGPALKYGDGEAAYAWKGVAVPGQLIEDKTKLTLELINREPDIFVRRCLIEIMTPERFLHLGGATRIARDSTGVLWHKMWWNGDAWAAVEVVNGTPEPDGTYKHYYLQVPADLRTARAAVAWTYGMTEHQYSQLAIRT